MSLPLTAEQREIGKTGIKVSAVGLGCMSLAPGYYGEVDDENSYKLLNKALDIGCNFWDTADRSGGGWNVNGKPEYAKSSCAGSLERLGTDYIDLYYLHRIDKNTPIEDTVTAMAELVKEGKVKYLGLSECSATTLRRAYKVHPITAVQVEYSPWTLDIERNGLLEACRELGVSVVAFSPLGRGFLTGQVKSLDDLSETDFRRQSPRFQGENFVKNLELADKIKEIADKKGVSASQLCLGWLLAQAPNVFVIPGTRKEKYLLDNVAGGSVKLTKQEQDEVRHIAESFEVAGERYNPEMMAIVDKDNI
ncbi:unnamed protein product [Umbelopsis vinacea]